MSRLTRDGTAEPVSRDQILRHARRRWNIIFPCSADPEQDWQPYQVDPYSDICDDHTYIHTYYCIHSVRVFSTYLKKKQNAPRPSEHPPVRGEKKSKCLGGILLSIPSQGGKNVKTFRWDQRLRIQNLFIAYKRVPRWKKHCVNIIMSGRSPSLYCTLTLIAMQGHQKKQ